MYKYDAIDQQLVNERVAQFRDQVRRWKGGELCDDEFRPLRLQNGLYVQRHAPMLRVAVPYAMMSSTQLPEDRPLWHLMVIKGLEDGSVALLLRIHHLVVDGGSMPVVWDLLQDHPKGPMVPEVHPFQQPRFGDPEMVVREVAGIAQMPLDLAKLAKSAGGWARTTLREKGLLALAVTPRSGTFRKFR